MPIEFHESHDFQMSFEYEGFYLEYMKGKLWDLPFAQGAD